MCNTRALFLCRISYSNYFASFLPLDVPDRFSNSPLHWATKEDNQPILLALIKGGADVNAKGHVGKTPLHIAVCNKKIFINKIIFLSFVMTVL